MSQLCPCHSQRTFSRCCGPYLNGTAFAPTAEALMRSRYTAFSTGQVDYLLSTQQSTCDLEGDRRQAERKSLQQSVNSTQWLNLVVVGVQKGKARDTTGVVEFVAAYRPKAVMTPGMGAQVQQMHERSCFERVTRSRFTKQDDQWLYTAGEQLAPYFPKRSEPCWCGSQKKFKQCHGNATGR